VGENTDVKQIYDIMYTQLPVKPSLYLSYNFKNEIFNVLAKRRRVRKTQSFWMCQFKTHNFTWNPPILDTLFNLQNAQDISIFLTLKMLFCVFAMLSSRKSLKKEHFSLSCVLQIEQCTYLSLFHPLFSSFSTFTDWINANSLELNEKLFFEKITASTYMRWKKVHQNSIKAF